MKQQTIEYLKVLANKYFDVAQDLCTNDNQVECVYQHYQHYQELCNVIELVELES